jgi:hypothetical protein
LSSNESALAKNSAARHLIQVTYRRRDGVDVAGCDVTGRERFLEARQRGADLLAVIRGARVAARLATLASQQILGSLGPALVGKRTLPTCDAHLDRVEPRRVLRDPPGNLGQLVAVHHIWIGSPQRRVHGIRVG